MSIMRYNYFDVHSHLNDVRFDIDRDQILAQMYEEGIGTLVVGTDQLMSSTAVQIAQKHQNVWAVVGQHPVDIPVEHFDHAYYKQLVTHPKVVAIGECGLDYYWPAKENWTRGEVKEKERQQNLFREHIKLARECGKPLMIHGRPAGDMDAYKDILSVLREFPGISGNVHFFAGTKEIARDFFDLGFTISFTGVITFSHDYDEVIKTAPLDRIMVETDSPYVAPVPHRGKRNDPRFCIDIVNRIAELRGEDVEVVAPILVANAIRAFRLS